MGADQQEDLPPEAVSARFGKYSLIKRLAVGGMAEIWLAKQTGVRGFEKLVVIKRILDQLAGETEFLQMFLDEARLAASLTHPNIVQIYDLGNVDESYFIAMEFIAGHDLHVIQKKGRRSKTLPPPELAARIIAEACEGLHYAHTRKDNRGNPLNIVHRDISPSNILVTYEGAVKIVDFGISKAESHTSKTRAGKLKGKFSYVSPEQIQGEAIDARSDVFGLGIVLHEILTGRRLFKRDNELTILNDILTAEVVPPSQLRESVPRELDEIVMRALQKDRRKRFASAQEMQIALEKFLSARPEPPGSIHLSNFMMERFAEEHKAYQKLLAELPTARPEDLAAYIPGDGNSIDPSLDVSFNDEADVPDSANSNPSLRPPRRISKKVKLAGVGVAALALVFLGALLVKPKPPPAAPTVGEIWVESEPAGAAIYVDGMKSSVITPGTVGQLPLEKDYHLRLELAGRESREQTVRLTSAFPNKAISVFLPREVARVGSLQLVTDPPRARVFLDAEERNGTTPMLLTDISPEVPHTLKLTLQGYKDEVLPVKVAAGQTLELRLTLKPRSDNVWGALRELTNRVEEKKANQENQPPPSKGPAR